jgi:ABC-type nitrate/sulfonate/bicarbonate transport system permease component
MRDGSRFPAPALLLSTFWYVWRCHASALSAKAALLRIAFTAFLAAGLGKAIGIALAKRGARHLFRK